MLLQMISDIFVLSVHLPSASENFVVPNIRPDSKKGRSSTLNISHVVLSITSCAIKNEDPM